MLFFLYVCYVIFTKFNLCYIKNLFNRIKVSTTCCCYLWNFPINVIFPLTAARAVAHFWRRYPSINTSFLFGFEFLLNVARKSDLTISNKLTLVILPKYFLHNTTPFPWISMKFTFFRAYFFSFCSRPIGLTPPLFLFSCVFGYLAWSKGLDLYS